MIWSLRVKEAQSREMFEDLSCIFEDESEELSFHLGFLDDHLGPKFLGGALEDLRAIGAVLCEKEREGKGEVGELIEFG